MTVNFKGERDENSYWVNCITMTENVINENLQQIVI